MITDLNREVVPSRSNHKIVSVIAKPINLWQYPMEKYLYLCQIREKDFLAALISFGLKCLFISSIPVTIPVKNCKK